MDSLKDKFLPGRIKFNEHQRNIHNNISDMK